MAAYMMRRIEKTHGRRAEPHRAPYTRMVQPVLYEPTKAYLSRAHEMYMHMPLGGPRSAVLPLPNPLDTCGTSA